MAGSTSREFQNQLTDLLPRMRILGAGTHTQPLAADDLVQEVAMKVLTASDSFILGSNFSAWVHRIMFNQFITTVRQKREAPPTSIKFPRRRYPPHSRTCLSFVNLTSHSDVCRRISRRHSDRSRSKNAAMRKCPRRPAACPPARSHRPRMPPPPARHAARHPRDTRPCARCPAASGPVRHPTGWPRASREGDSTPGHLVKKGGVHAHPVLDRVRAGGDGGAAAGGLLAVHRDATAGGVHGGHHGGENVSCDGRLARHPVTYDLRPGPGRLCGRHRR